MKTPASIHNIEFLAKIKNTSIQYHDIFTAAKKISSFNGIRVKMANYDLLYKLKVYVEEK